MADLPLIVSEDEEGFRSRADLDRILADAQAQGMAVIVRSVKAPYARRRRPKGRPTRLNAALIEEIAHRIAQGEHQEQAALAVGVAKSTYQSWKSKGEEARVAADNGVPIPPEREIYVDFLTTVEEARALAESRVVQALQRAALGGDVSSLREWEDAEGQIHREATFTRPNVAAMTWWLERAFPHRYGRRLEVSGPDGEAIPVEVEISARDLLRKKLDETADRLKVVRDEEQAS